MMVDLGPGEGQLVRGKVRLGDGEVKPGEEEEGLLMGCLLYTSPSPRDSGISRMPSSA